MDGKFDPRILYSDKFCCLGRQYCSLKTTTNRELKERPLSVSLNTYPVSHSSELGSTKSVGSFSKGVLTSCDVLRPVLRLAIERSSAYIPGNNGKAIGLFEYITKDT